VTPSGKSAERTRTYDFEKHNVNEQFHDEKRRQYDYDVRKVGNCTHNNPSAFDQFTQFAQRNCSTIARRAEIGEARFFAISPCE
jgi:hypothetical protein